MRRIIYNKNKFFSEEDPPEEEDDDNVPEQPDEPIDYLHGNPATVLDLRTPLIKFENLTSPENIRNEYNEEYPRSDHKFDDAFEKRLADLREREVNDYIEGYKYAVDNYNKESAINHRLNELGSTNYDFAGESNRKFEGSLHSPLTSKAHAFEAPSAVHYLSPETLYIGVGKSPYLDTSDAIAHELGHVNDPHLRPFWSLKSDSYDTEYTRDDIESRWGKPIADAYESMQPNGVGSASFTHDHRPSEIYADASALRSDLFKSGAWNGKDPITEDMVNNYMKSESGYLIGTYGRDADYLYGNPTASKRMAHYFNPTQIADILNSSRRYSIK